MSELLITCGCGDTDKFATDAFKILFPDQSLPPIRHGVSHKEPNLIKEYVSALMKNNDKFAYYLKWDKTSLDIWDLLKGIRIL